MQKKLLFLICLGLFSVLLPAHAKKVSLKEFTEEYRKNLKEQRKNKPANYNPCEAIEPNPTPYSASSAVELINIADLCATQSNFSFYKITLEFNKSKPTDKAIEYILFQERRYIVDGHHFTLMALYNGETTIKAQMIEHVTEPFTQDEFIQYLRQKGYIYDRLTDPMNLVDDIYLNKIRELTRDTEIVNKELILKGKKNLGDMVAAFAPGKNYYSEQYASEVLKEAGYNIQNISAKKVLEILKHAQKNGDSRVKNIILLDDPIEIKGKKTFEEAQDLIREKAKRPYRRTSTKTRRCSQWLQQGSPP